METAIIANALAEIGNTYFGKNYDTDRIALTAIYHDATEIMTGDLPTPVKYYDAKHQQCDYCYKGNYCRY